MTTDIKSNVFYVNKEDCTVTELLSCNKDNIDEVFDKLKLPDSCSYYLHKSKVLLKSLSEYDLGANVLIERDVDNEIKTRVVDLIDYSNTQDSALSPARSVISLFIMFGTGVDYSIIADPSKHKVNILEEKTTEDVNEVLLRYTNTSEESELDVTFVYAICEYSENYFKVKATYDLETNSFKNNNNEIVNNPFITNVKENYEKLFRRE